MQVIAEDTKGNKFVKKVTTHISQDKYSRGLIICFGGPVEYYAEDLLKHYPFQKPMCIDMGGLNHKGFQVHVNAEQMDKIVEEFVPRQAEQIIKENQNNNGDEELADRLKQVNEEQAAKEAAENN